MTWLTRYLRLQKKYDADIDELLRRAAEDAANDLETTMAFGVRSAQARAAVVAIQSTLSYFWTSFGDVVKAGRAEAAAEAAVLSFNNDAPKWRRIFTAKNRRDDLRDALERSARANVEAAIARIYKSYTPLSQQVYKTKALADGWVDKRVESGLARGLTVREMQKEVKEFIRPETKGGVSYAARRLARTEINNAYHATTIVENADKPWVSGMIWRLSGSHPRIDICNVYADKSPWPRDKVPAKAHPQCLCTTFPETVSDDDFWAAFRAGDYDSWLDSLPS